MFGLSSASVPIPAPERHSIRLEGRDIPYTLKRSKRRSIGLRIDDDGLTVSLPLRATQKWLHEVLQERSGWIVRQLANWEARRPAPQQWVDGELLRFMGEPLTLHVVASLFAAPPLLQGRNLYVHVGDPADQATVEQVVTRWYQRQAEILFKDRVAHYAPKMNVAPQTVRLSAARTQWGSCTAQGSVRLNWQLIKLPLRLIDYVVVHELAHLVEMNHSAAFWQVVGQTCPDYAQRRKELRKCALGVE